MNKLNFKHLISIVEGEGGTDAGGFPTPGGGEFTKAWADIKTMKGNEFYSAKAIARVGISRFIIRYIPDIKQDMKVEFNGKTYNLESIENDDEQNRTITMIGTTQEL